MAHKGIIEVATCQFPVGMDVRRNAAWVRRQVEQAATMGADLAHFSECCLSGYAGTEVKSWAGYDWNLLTGETRAICDLARRKGLWVILGSSHRLTGERLPHNCLYVIDPAGEIVERYDKCFCTGGDMDFYSPGDRLSVFDVGGVRCGCAICYDIRFPELYRAYKKRGVQCMFDSFYNARSSGPNIHTVIMRASMQCRAATNYMWISGNNSSGRYQSWQSVFVQPDGRIVRQLRRNRAGVMVNTVDTTVKFYDASGPFRDRAMRGVMHSGELVEDARSRDRTSL